MNLPKSLVFFDVFFLTCFFAHDSMILQMEQLGAMRGPSHGGQWIHCSQG